MAKLPNVRAREGVAELAELKYLQSIGHKVITSPTAEELIEKWESTGPTPDGVVHFGIDPDSETRYRVESFPQFTHFARVTISAASTDELVEREKIVVLMNEGKIPWPVR